MTASDTIAATAVPSPVTKKPKTGDSEKMTNAVEEKPYFKVKKLSADAILPKRGSAHAAGYDVCAYHHIH